MATKGWIKQAQKQGVLRITENLNCPYCNPSRKDDVLTNVNACEEHIWVNKKWYEERF